MSETRFRKRVAMFVGLSEEVVVLVVTPHNMQARGKGYTNMPHPVISRLFDMILPLVLFAAKTALVLESQTQMTVLASDLHTLVPSCLGPRLVNSSSQSCDGSQRRRYSGLGPRSEHH